MDEQDQRDIAAIGDLIRRHLWRMTAREIRSAAVVLRALERLPHATPGAWVRFGFSTPQAGGNYRWADVEFLGPEFCLSLGAHYYDPDVGGDTETSVAFEWFAGTDSRAGDIQEWLTEAESIAASHTYTVEDESEYGDIDWFSEGAPESPDE